jgi:hypothetical protein
MGNHQLISATETSEFVARLMRGYTVYCAVGGEQVPKAVYVAEGIFNLTLYDDEMAEWFASAILEVCAVVLYRDQHRYLRSSSNHIKYLMVLNLPFFSGHLAWGSNIQGAWFHKGFLVERTAYLGDCAEQGFEVPVESFAGFLRAIQEFVGGE